MSSIDLQVAANTDDMNQTRANGFTVDDPTSVYHTSGEDGWNQQYAGHRWVSGSLPVMGDVIDVCYIQLYSTNAVNPMYGHWHFQKAAAPATFVAGVNYNISGRPRTTAFVNWSQNVAAASWYTSPSLVTPMQELIDSYSPTAIAAIYDPQTVAGQIFWTTKPHNDTPSLAAKLHIEWHSPPVEGGGALKYPREMRQHQRIRANA